jgi:hypothetical protein
MSLAEVESPSGAHTLLASNLAVRIRRAVPLETCAEWTQGVLAARSEWTEDFDGEQFCLGRAFYTHLETDRAGDYFEDAASSNARVERCVPGLQSRLRELLGAALEARVVPRPDWCAAGVHVFPEGSPVAMEGGVVHFDVEGLAEEHVVARKRAVSLVVMLLGPETGGGLRVWSRRFAGNPFVDAGALRDTGVARVELSAGDAVLFDSYTLHQIEPFAGSRPRITATVHVAELQRGLWECWF